MFRPKVVEDMKKEKILAFIRIGMLFDCYYNFIFYCEKIWMDRYFDFR